MNKVLNVVCLCAQLPHVLVLQTFRLHIHYLDLSGKKVGLFNGLILYTFYYIFYPPSKATIS